MHLSRSRPQAGLPKAEDGTEHHSWGDDMIRWLMPPKPLWMFAIRAPSPTPSPQEQRVLKTQAKSKETSGQATQSLQASADRPKFVQSWFITGTWHLPVSRWHYCQHCPTLLSSFWTNPVGTMSQTGVGQRKLTITEAGIAARLDLLGLRAHWLSVPCWAAQCHAWWLRPLVLLAVLPWDSQMLADSILWIQPKQQ